VASSDDALRKRGGEARVPEAGLPEAPPDVVEETAGDPIDNIVPSYGYRMAPMVGIGGSAGAFPGLQAFFEAMPPNSGMTFVVVMHLSPHHASSMAEMIGQWTKMPVKQATDGEKVEADHVYVIPPGKHLIAVDGHLTLTDLDHTHGRRIAVDLFFRSLAETHGPHAAAIVLSGADGDGMLGIKRIKERGGLTIAQDPDEAQHPSMPRTSIDTGMVDWVLKAAEMPQRILDYVAQERKLELPPEDGPAPAAATRAGAGEPEGAFREILVFLRRRTGRDFSYYKRATIVRRISRRMQVNAVDDMGSYLSFLRTHPGEAGALLDDLLISVTNFFRDRDAFAALEARIPKLFQGKTQGDTVRAWCPACATGEEAYSVAMLLVEHARTLDQPPAIQVFGCDLDDEAVRSARAGVFPEAIAADVSEARLRRFFVKEPRGYQVRRELRELVLFATHDLLKDAPFSRLDLVTCRNLLIYLNREAQERAFDVFHFALKPDGLLFLGSSESVDEDSALFRALDKKHRLYVRKAAGRTGLPLPGGPSTLLVRQMESEVAQRHADTLKAPVVVPPVAFSSTAAVPLGAGRPARRGDDERITWGELHLKLVERFGPPSVLVDRDYDIQHVSESAGRFLQVTGGPPTTNLLRLVHPALRLELRALLFRALHSGTPEDALQVPIELDGKRHAVDLRVVPTTELLPDYTLVTFDAREPAQEPDRPAAVPSLPEPLVRQLEKELEQMKRQLRATIGQYEASTEELRASNEELQAMNEELRSATEELETSREELQSINEELTTVNQELKHKVDELGHANSDMHNLMSATAIATLFLDRDMRVMRFTDSAAPIFNLIPADVGRPLANLQHRVDYPQMAADAASVLERLTPIHREVRGEGDTAYLARMLPYRTLDDRIAGVVLAFVDVTERERVKRALHEDLASTERLRVVAEQLASDEGMQGLFDAIVDAAVTVSHADGGTVQLFDAPSGTLRLLAAEGLPREVTERFAVVDASSGTPDGVALHTGRRHYTDYAAGSPGSEASDRWQREAVGLRCSLSTPLVARGGQRIGMLTTYWRAPHEPSDRELRYIDLLARQAADAIERQVALDALRRNVEELRRFNEAAVGRETRMIELKKEVNALAERLGETPRYPLDFEKDTD
jgi:two-component system CheB/CheR fusion protein